MEKRNRVLALTVAAAMSASLLAGCSSSAQQGGAASSEAASTDTAASVSDGGEDNIIRVGVVCSMTGGSAIYGEGAQNAVDMAVEEINADDSGYKIEIVNGGKVADDAKDAKQAMNAYNKVMADSPEAIVGSFFSSVTLPMAEQASKDGMLLLATGATNADVTLKGDSIFRNCFIDPYQGKMAALFAKDKGFAKVAVIYAKDDDYSNGLKDAFVENCEANGIDFVSTKVGDRYVLESMLQNGYNIGGEQSGHIIFLDHSTTGDGELSGAMLLSIMKRTGEKLSDLAKIMERYPQVLINVKVSNEGKLSFYTDKEVKAEINRVTEILGDTGRILVRVSGTEPLVRVMLEGENLEQIQTLAEEAAQVVRERLA